MKKQTKLTKKQLALKKQRQKHYITAALLVTAIVLIGVFFYTLKPSSGAVKIDLQIEPETQQSENNTITRIYPGLINATARCVVNGELVEIAPTNVIESHNEYLYRLEVYFTFPDPFVNTITDRVVILQFNVSLTNATVCVNNFCSPNELNSPIESIQFNGGTVEIALKSVSMVQVTVQTPIPARRDEE